MRNGCCERLKEKTVANDAEFPTNLLRLLCGQLWSLLSLTASRELFSKSYYALSAQEKQAVDQVVLNQIGANYAGMTPEYLKGSEAKNAAGFQTEVGASADSQQAQKSQT